MRYSGVIAGDRGERSTAMPGSKLEDGGDPSTAHCVCAHGERKISAMPMGTEASAKRDRGAIDQNTDRSAKRDRRDKFKNGPERSDFDKDSVLVLHLMRAVKLGGVYNMQP